MVGEWVFRRAATRQKVSGCRPTAALDDKNYSSWAGYVKSLKPKGRKGFANVALDGCVVSVGSSAWRLNWGAGVL